MERKADITAQAELFALLLVEGCATVQARVAQDFVSLGRGERPGARAQRACKRATTLGGAEEHSASTLRLARRGARGVGDETEFFERHTPGWGAH